VFRKCNLKENVLQIAGHIDLGFVPAREFLSPDPSTEIVKEHTCTHVRFENMSYYWRELSLQILKRYTYDFFRKFFVDSLDLLLTVINNRYFF